MKKNAFYVTEVNDGLNGINARNWDNRDVIKLVMSQIKSKKPLIKQALFRLFGYCVIFFILAIIWYFPNWLFN